MKRLNEQFSGVRNRRQHSREVINEIVRKLDGNSREKWKWKKIITSFCKVKIMILRPGMEDQWKSYKSLNLLLCSSAKQSCLSIASLFGQCKQDYNNKE